MEAESSSACLERDAPAKHDELKPNLIRRHITPAARMAVLSFSLTPEATGRIYEALVCLAKFGESLAIDARGDKLTLTALNLSKTAYASFALDARSFFSSYTFNASSPSANGDRFTCQLYNRALQSVFKGRANDIRGRETGIERCDVNIQDRPDKAECRLVVKMLCKHGMTKTYRLTYEAAEVMHALFDKTAAAQGWRISSRVMREYVEYFGPKTEQLDLCASGGKAIFTSFTEKIQDGQQVLKQPLETVIMLHTEDFDDFHMQENVHITIRVRDFKAVVMHAETLHTPISAHFSHPTRPLQFSYQNEGMACSFTLMTMGDYRGASSTPNPNFVSTRSASRQPSIAPMPQLSRNTSEMPPPARPAPRLNPAKSISSQGQRKPLRPQSHQPVAPAPEPDDDSLFMPAGDEERTWDPPNFDQDEEEEEMLGWDASNNMRGSEPHPTFRDTGSAIPPSRQGQQSQQTPSQWEDGLEPTQRLSQLHGMFD